MTAVQRTEIAAEIQKDSMMPSWSLRLFSLFCGRYQYSPLSRPSVAEWAMVKSSVCAETKMPNSAAPKTRAITKVNRGPQTLRIVPTTLIIMAFFRNLLSVSKLPMVSQI